MRRAIITFFVVASFGLPVCHDASGDTFGTDDNTFEIEFVTVGSPGNPNDLTGNPQPGKVDYTYRVGQFEISEDMIDNANALGAWGLATTTSVPTSRPSSTGTRQRSS